MRLAQERFQAEVWRTVLHGPHVMEEAHGYRQRRLRYIARRSVWQHVHRSALADSTWLAVGQLSDLPGWWHAVHTDRTPSHLQPFLKNAVEVYDLKGFLLAMGDQAVNCLAIAQDIVFTWDLWDEFRSSPEYAAALHHKWAVTSL